MLVNSAYLSESLEKDSQTLNDRALGKLVNAVNPSAVVDKIGSEAYDVKRISMHSLLGESIYKDDGKAAEQFIDYASGLATPLTIMPQTADNKNLPEYNVAVREYAAAQSVGLSNLYFMVAARLPTLNAPAALKDKAIDGKVSARQIDQYLAEKRVVTPQWYIETTKASPAVIARETLYVLAEMRMEMYKARLLNERLLAVTSLQQMQNSYAKAKQVLPKMSSEAFKELLDKKSKEAGARCCLQIESSPVGSDLETVC